MPETTRAPAAAASSQTPTTQPIPFRTSSAVSTGQVASVLGMTVLLLGAFFAALLLARRQGWLRRWIGGRADAAGQRKRSGPRVLSSTRLSASAQAHVVDVEGLRFVVFESSRQLAVQPMAGKDENGETDAS